MRGEAAGTADGGGQGNCAQGSGPPGVHNLAMPANSTKGRALSAGTQPENGEGRGRFYQSHLLRNSPQLW